jgi:integrase
MHESTRVYVSRVGNRPNWHLEWKHPITGRSVRKKTDVLVSAGRRGRARAERLAKDMEDQLRSGSGDIPTKLRWSEFRERYETLALPGLAKATAVKVSGVFDRVERIVAPTALRDLCPLRLSFLAAQLRTDGLAEATIHSYLAHLRSALQWAVTQRLLGQVPQFPKLQRCKKGRRSSPMKGRPLAQEEYERELEFVGRVVGEAAAAQWKWYMRGLWVSGLRLQESLDLWWDREDRIHPVFPRSGRPFLVIHAELEKGNKDRRLPIAPEFEEMLLEVPEERRVGRVLPLVGRRGPYQACQVSAILSRIGRAAGVVVGEHPRTGRVKYASAHDFRRTFATRWAARGLSVAQLTDMMRHETFETTRRYYVSLDAQQIAESCWDAYRRSQASNGGGFSDKSSDIDGSPTPVQWPYPLGTPAETAI